MHSNSKWNFNVATEVFLLFFVYILDKKICSIHCKQYWRTCVVQTGLGCPVFHFCVYYNFNLSVFWPIAFTILLIKVLRRAIQELILFVPTYFWFFFPFSFHSLHFNRNTAAFRWYRAHWQLLLLQSYFMRTSEDTNWGIYLFFLFYVFLYCRYTKRSNRHGK